MYDGEWAYAIGGVKKNTAGISIHQRDGLKTQRYVAARDANDIYDKTPSLTIRQALERAFGATEKANGDLSFYDETTRKEYLLNPEMVHVSFGGNTLYSMGQQFVNDFSPNSFYDFIIRPEMDIRITLPDFFSNFDNNDTGQWDNRTNVQDGNRKAIRIASNQAALTRLNLSGLSQDVLYQGSAFARCESGNSGILVFLVVMFCLIL